PHRPPPTHPGAARPPATPPAAAASSAADAGRTGGGSGSGPAGSWSTGCLSARSSGPATTPSVSTGASTPTATAGSATPSQPPSGPAFCWGHQGLVVAVLVGLPFTRRLWALPVLVARQRSEADQRRRCRRQKTPPQRQRVLRRWFPRRPF